MDSRTEFIQSLPLLPYADRRKIRKEVLGDILEEPKPEHYKVHKGLTVENDYTLADYLLYTTITILIVILITLTAGISALRIHAAGSELCEMAHPEFAVKTVPFTGWVVCEFTGWALVPVSEAALFVFPLIATVIGDKKRRDSVFWLTTLGMFLSLIFTLTMNFYIERPDKHSYDLAVGSAVYLFWLVAPTFALILTWCIKLMVVSYIGNQYTQREEQRVKAAESRAQYETALKQYKEYVLQPDTHPKYKNVYGQRLYEYLRNIYYPSLGYSEDDLRLSHDHWKTIVRREIDQDTISFEGGSLTQQRLEDQNIEVRLKEDGLYYGYIVDLAYETPKGYASETRARNTALKYARQYGAS